MHLCFQVVLGLKLEYLDAVGREQLTAAELLEFWAQAALLPDHDVLVSRHGCAAGICICCLYNLCNVHCFLASSEANALLLMQCVACS